MGFEGDAPEAKMTIVACESPRHLALSAVNDYGSWHLEAILAESDVGDVRPGSSTTSTTWLSPG